MLARSPLPASLPFICRHSECPPHLATTVRQPPCRFLSKVQGLPVSGRPLCGVLGCQILHLSPSTLSTPRRQSRTA